MSVYCVHDALKTCLSLLSLFIIIYSFLNQIIIILHVHVNLVVHTDKLLSFAALTPTFLNCSTCILDCSPSHLAWLQINSIRNFPLALVNGCFQRFPVHTFSRVSKTSPSHPPSAKSQTVHFKKNRNGEVGSLVWAACQNDQSAVAAKYGHGASCGPTYFARHRYFMHKHTRAHSTTHVRGGDCERAFLT